MAPKFKLKSTTCDADDDTAEAPRRSTRSARGTGGALRQMELVESLQVAPRMPQNAEARRIKHTLSTQPENVLAPSRTSRRKAKGPEIPYVPQEPPSPVLPRKQLAGSMNSFGFYGGRNFSQPPFTQEDRGHRGRSFSHQEEDDSGGEDSAVEGISRGVADLHSDDHEAFVPGEDEDGERSARADDSDDEQDVIRKRKSECRRVMDSEDEIATDDNAAAEEVPSGSLPRNTTRWDVMGKRTHARQRVDSEDDAAIDNAVSDKAMSVVDDEDDISDSLLLSKTACPSTPSGQLQCSEDDGGDPQTPLFPKTARSRVPSGKPSKDEQPSRKTGSSGAASGTQARNGQPRASLLPQTVRSVALPGKPGRNGIGLEAQGDEADHSHVSSHRKTAHTGAARTKASNQALSQQPVPKLNLSKRPASPSTNVQRKVARKPSTIASRGRGGSTATARSRQVSEPRDNSNSEVPHDVLLDHHIRNGVPRAPDPAYLATLANKNRTDHSTPDVDDTNVENSRFVKSRNGGCKDPTTLKFYDKVWRAILNRAKSLSRLDAIINNAFPERQAYVNNAATEFITQTAAEFEEDGVQPDKSVLRDHQYHMSDLLFEDLGTFRSDFKKVARQVVAKHWDWEPRDFDSPQQLTEHVLELCNELMEGTKYIHGDADDEGKFNNFSSAALRDLCVTGYYVKSSLAVTFPEIFSNRLPAGALAFAATALTAAMDEYSSGTFVAAKFRHEEYSRVHEQFVDMIGSIEKVPHRLRNLRGILKNIATQGCAKNPTVGAGSGQTVNNGRKFTMHLD